MLPEAAQARKAIWDAINPHTGKKRIDEAFPEERARPTRDTTCSSASQRLDVAGGRLRQLRQPGGLAAGGRGLLRMALAKPDAWTYIRPILAENGGWAIFIWTPRGRNHATRAFEAREQDPNWFTQRSTAAADQRVHALSSWPRTPGADRRGGSEEEGDAKYRQEYLVDFDAAVPGSYYGADQEGDRRGPHRHLPHDPALPVDTAWDIGVDDYTAIWFLQDNGKRVRAIDYFETSARAPRPSCGRPA
jgi:phage terminase large subunit